MDELNEAFAEVRQVLQVHCPEVVEVLRHRDERHTAEHGGEERRGSVEREDGGEEAEQEGEVDSEEDLALLVVVERYHVKREGVAGDGTLPVAPDPVLRVAHEFELLSKVCGETREEPPRRAGYHIAGDNSELFPFRRC